MLRASLPGASLHAWASPPPPGGVRFRRHLGRARSCYCRAVSLPRRSGIPLRPWLFPALLPRFFVSPGHYVARPPPPAKPSRSDAGSCRRYLPGANHSGPAHRQAGNPSAFSAGEICRQYRRESKSEGASEGNSEGKSEGKSEAETSHRAPCEVADPEEVTAVVPPSFSAMIQLQRPHLTARKVLPSLLFSGARSSVVVRATTAHLRALCANVFAQ